MDDAVKASHSWSDLARKLRGNCCYGNIQTVKRYVALYELDTNHFDPSHNRHIKSPIYNNKDIFVENSPVSNTVLAKYYRRLVPAKECSECGIGTVWNGKPLTLHIDHINGHGTDWRLANCRYLCPNCHYQTDTHGTKRGLSKRAGEIRATAAELSDSFDEHKCYKIVGMIYGLSDRTVKNIIRKYLKFSSQTENISISHQ